MEVLNEYLAVLWGYFQYDLEMYSQWWMYVFFLIPATFYTLFFIFKWALLLAPLWLPVSLVAGAVRGTLFGGSEDDSRAKAIVKLRENIARALYENRAVVLGQSGLPQRSWADLRASERLPWYEEANRVLEITP